MFPTYQDLNVGISSSGTNTSLSDRYNLPHLQVPPATPTYPGHHQIVQHSNYPQPLHYANPYPPANLQSFYPRADYPTNRTGAVTNGYPQPQYIPPPPPLHHVPPPQKISRAGEIAKKFGYRLYPGASLPVTYLDGNPLRLELQIANYSGIEALHQYLREYLKDRNRTDQAFTEADHLEVGTILCAKWALDQALYRAKVEENNGGGCYMVRFIDYGNSDVCDISDGMWKLEPEIASIPPQAVTCRMLGYEGMLSWKTDKLQRFREMMQFHDKQMTGCFYEIKSAVGLAWEVDLLCQFKVKDYLFMHKFDLDDNLDGSGNQNDSIIDVETLDVSHVDAMRNLKIAAKEEKAKSSTSSLSVDVGEDEGVMLPVELPSPVEEAVKKEAAVKVEDWFDRNDDKSTSVITSEDLFRPEPSKSPDFVFKDPFYTASTNIPMLDIVVNVKGYFEFVISHLKGLEKFYIQAVQKEVEQLVEHQEDLQTAYSNDNRDFMMEALEMPAGSKVAFRGKDGIWYRGEILKKERKYSLCVFSIDFGDYETVKASMIRPLQEKFVTLPRMAIPCCLAHIEPLDREQEFSDKAVKFVKEALGETANQAVIDKWEHGICQIIVEVKGKWCLNQELKDRGYVKEPTITVEEPEEKQHVFDPLKEDYDSITNTYKFRNDDVQMVNEHYQPKDERRICKFYRVNKFCARGKACHFEHIYTGDDFIPATTDQDEVITMQDHLAELPNVDTRILVQVTVVMSPENFFIIMPYGKTDLKKILEDSQKLMSNMQKEESLESLNRELTKHYSSHRFRKDIPILATGQIIAAQYPKDRRWYRAQITDLNEEANESDDSCQEILVFFVDFGNTEWVPLANVRVIENRFLRLPFQAVQCSLYGITSTGSFWTSEARETMFKLIKSKTCIAEVIEIDDKSIVGVKLITHDDNEQVDVGKVLIEQGYAQKVRITGIDHSYVPG